MPSTSNRRPSPLYLAHSGSSQLALPSFKRLVFAQVRLTTYPLHTPSLYIRPVHILNTQHCIATSREYLALPSIVTCINDTLVFLAISFRLTADAATERTWRARAQSIFQGKGLYSLSRSLMKSGQTYYLYAPCFIYVSLHATRLTLPLSTSASIIFFIISLVVMFSPTVPAASHYLLTPGYLAFTNIMACHIFRGVALGMMEGPSGLTTTKIAAALQTDPRINKEPSGDVQVS